MFEVSVPKKGGTPDMARRITSSLARNVARRHPADHRPGRRLADEAGVPAASTVTAYLNMFEDMYVIESLCGWDAPVRAKSRLRTKPKRYFADPSIPAAALGMGPGRLLSDGRLSGCCSRRCASTTCGPTQPGLARRAPRSLRYYGDSDGLEVDVIIELRDGRWAALEVKPRRGQGARRHQEHRAPTQEGRVQPAARNPEPEFSAVVTATSPFCRHDAEHDVYVFPITALRP